MTPEERRARNSEYLKRYYADCVKDKICPRCHKSKAFGRFRYCEYCLEYAQVSSGKYKDGNREQTLGYLKDRYAKLKEAGLCVRCGKNPQANGVLCLTCRFHQNLYQKAKARPYREPPVYTPGICRIKGCGDPVCGGGKGLYCQYHYGIMAERMAHARQAAYENRTGWHRPGDWMGKGWQ